MYHMLVFLYFSHMKEVASCICCFVVCLVLLYVQIFFNQYEPIIRELCKYILTYSDIIFIILNTLTLITKSKSKILLLIWLTYTIIIFSIENV